VCQQAAWKYVGLSSSTHANEIIWNWCMTVALANYALIQNSFALYGTHYCFIQFLWIFWNIAGIFQGLLPHLDVLSFSVLNMCFILLCIECRLMSVCTVHCTIFVLCYPVVIPFWTLFVCKYSTFCSLLPHSHIPLWHIRHMCSLSLLTSGIYNDIYMYSDLLSLSVMLLHYS
jgi:hypothetical protein